MKTSEITEEKIKEAWYTYLTTGNMPKDHHAPWYDRKSMRPFVKRIPKSPRCSVCYIPFKGIGGFFFKTFYGIEASKLNPHICNQCERFATKFHGGVEMETAVMFVDVRNSTAMAEKLTPEEFSKKINHFYKATTNIFYKNYGWVEKFQGDEVGGFFVKGFAGPHFSNNAIKTGIQILKALGYNSATGPWIQAGVGIHTGIAYIGSVTASNDVYDISILGDTVNVAARLTSLAAPGEIIMSEETRKAANIPVKGLEHRMLSLKGKTEPFAAWAMKV